MLKLIFTEPLDSHPKSEIYEPVAVFPEPFIAVIRTVSFISSVQLNIKLTAYAPEFVEFI